MTIDSNVLSVMEKLLQRAKIGLEKYGVPTAENELSKEEWLIHLQEELMDACVYIECLLQNETPPSKLIDDGASIP